MKLSICIITYNHAAFIATAIEGALMQRTNFDFEIVIGEDESNDGTRAIVSEYAKKYPGKIKTVFGSRKDVIYFRGKPTGRRNLIETLKNCTGDYVAMLDGDDFWTDPEKLQQQVDFLEANKQYAICAHDVTKLYPDGREEPSTNAVGSYDFSDLLTLKHYPATCSVVYRNHLINPLPKWYSEVMVGDFPLHLLNARHGRIAHLPKTMAMYRQHAGGMWAGWASDRKKSYARQLAWNDGLIHLYQTADDAFDRQYHTLIRKKIAELTYEKAWLLYNSQDLSAARKSVTEALVLSPMSRGSLKWSYMFRLWAAAICPWGYRAYCKTKRLIQPERAKAT